ncbi:MAG: class I SAM-dependent methyltransferase [Candidatus Hodarchaeales archaeon]|jgi:ubiquinone/menaquinone biosynthesis C-methylase UbiE
MDYPDYTKTEVQQWINSLGPAFFREIGLEKGQTVLDFGCGIGNYSLPAALSVGSTGRVYALDKVGGPDDDPIAQLIPRAEEMGLGKIIIPIKTKGEMSIKLPDDSIDLVLLLDVVPGLLATELNTDSPQQPGALRMLIQELYRVLTNGGRLLVTLPHLEECKLSLKAITSEIQNHLDYIEVKTMQMLHWDFFEEETVYIFQKRS